MFEGYPFYWKIFLILVGVIGNFFSIGFFILPIFIYRNIRRKNSVLIKKMEDEDKR